jgi:hypothetical protein
LLLELETHCIPAISDNPSREDALAARDRLLEVVIDFPFAHTVHKACWLAALLTPLARFAMSGPAPLFLVDANAPGAGKGLLLDCISRIVVGEQFTIATYSHDEDELRKRITSMALSGERLVLFDNLVGQFGNSVLDAALTATAWNDRVLGGNRMMEAPLYMTWYATGNNVAIAADTARRMCQIRLESPEEHPEDRKEFRHPQLLAFIAANRSRLLAAALTVLRAYCVAGRPNLGLPAWGSFEGWSSLVRSAVVWLDMPDPAETRLQLREQADAARESMGILLSCWEKMDSDGKGLTTAEVIQRVYDKAESHSHPDWHADMKSALESLLRRPDARLLGNKLRTFRRRIFCGRFIDRAATEHRAVRWAVFPASAFGERLKMTPETHQTHPPVSECYECDEYSLADGETRS